MPALRCTRIGGPNACYIGIDPFDNSVQSSEESCSQFSHHPVVIFGGGICWHVFGEASAGNVGGESNGVGA